MTLQAQQALLVVLERFSEEIGTTPVDEWTDGHVASRLELLAIYWSNFLDNHMTLLQDEDARTSNYFTDDQYARGEKAYIVGRGRLYDIQPQPLPLSISESTSRHGGVKLPRITLPKFNGARKNWESFRDLFKSLIHGDSDLTDVEKLYCLQTHIEGEPKQALDHLPITSSNYRGAWEALTSRYDQKRLLILGHLNALLHLLSMKTESATSLQRLIDELESHRSQLVTLGRPVKTWDDWFVILASAAMDADTRRAWEEELEEQCSDNKPIPTFAQLTSFLQRRCRILKSLEMERSSTSAGALKRTGGIFKPPPLRVFATTSNTIGDRLCPVCQGSHYVCYCEAFKGLNPLERRRTVTRHGLCYNFLRTNHRAANCPSQGLCRTCNAPHHTLIHEGAGKRMGDTSIPRIPEKVPRTMSSAATATSGIEEETTS